MQKRFPSLSFCVGIAFGKRRAEAVVRWCGCEWRARCGCVWRAVRWCGRVVRGAVVWVCTRVACAVRVCVARGAVVAFAETEVRVEISGDCGKST